MSRPVYSEGGELVYASDTLLVNNLVAALYTLLSGSVVTNFALNGLNLNPKRSFGPFFLISNSLLHWNC